MPDKSRSRTLDQPELIDEIKALDGAGGKVEAGYDAVPGAELDLEAIARELNAEPSNARYDIPSGKVVDGQIGVNLDPQAAAFALDAAAPGERILLPAEVTYPKMTAAELEAVLLLRLVQGAALGGLDGVDAVLRQLIAAVHLGLVESRRHYRRR